jgi:hypothetical protein
MAEFISGQNVRHHKFYYFNILTSPQTKYISAQLRIHPGPVAIVFAPVSNAYPGVTVPLSPRVHKL